LRRLVTASAALLALAGAATSFGAPLAAGRQQTLSRAALTYYGKEIARFERQTWYWQHVIGVRTTPAAGRSLAALSGDEIRRVDQRWQARSTAAYRRAQHPPHLQALLCIHRYEGSWHDGGGPYYGGLQMDVGFQQTYGGWLYRTKGTADHWAPLEQIWTAEHAVRGRGFWPWPSTARLCGVL
jgi:hypothetical protein